jgi:GR25 family glycosyltransferase involved in LPS biosynthesis
MYIVWLSTCLLLHLWLSGINADRALKNEKIPIEIFYINLNDSYDRRLSMNEHLNKVGYPYQRIEAVNTKGIRYNLVQNATNYLNWKEQTVEPLIIPAQFLGYSSIKINKLFARSKFRLIDMGCTLSHLLAIYTALNSNSDIDYALILEDDMRIGFDIDFSKFISTLPTDFGIVQMATSNSVQVNELLDRYKLKGVHYISRGERDLWWAGGYLLNKRTLKTHMRAILQNDASVSRVLSLDLIAGSNHPCSPKLCCHNGSFHNRFPCVLSRRGIFADQYIYNIAYGHTYMTTIPLVQGTELGNISTIDPLHIPFTSKALNEVDSIIADMKSGKLNLPPYAKIPTW